MSRLTPFSAVPVILALLIACARGELAETSMNFDQANVSEFMGELSAAYPAGFSTADADRVTAAIEALPVKASGSWEFTITADGRSERLVISALKDDVDAPDIAFHGSPAVTARIESMLTAFAKAHGQ